MYMSCADIQKKVLELLEKDSALAAHVKDFSIGKEKTSRVLFPYVSVIDVNSRAEPQSIGPNAKALYRYDIVILTGSRNMKPELAHAGDGGGNKGVVQLNDDVVNALYPGTIGGSFKRTIKLISASMDEEESGRTWMGTIRFRGFRAA